jgi:hypothetical protein
MVVDLLGKGTACIVWSSPLPREAKCPVNTIILESTSLRLVFFYVRLAKGQSLP